MPPPAKDVEFTVHGVTYIRSGKCSRCGDCCRPKNCIHFLDGDPATCLIQSERIKRNFSCNKCMTAESEYWFKPIISGVSGRLVQHTICKLFPNHPFLRAITSGICSYVFTPKTLEDETKHQILIEKWQ